MVARKKFAEPNDINQFRLMQKLLPDAFKMKILLGKSEGKMCAGAICSAMGDTALYRFDATSNAGMKSRGSYVLQWRFVENLKRDGIAVYDLNGINPETNPGTFKFKSDLAGDHGADVSFIGTFDAQSEVLSRACVRMWNLLKTRRSRARK
jgi:lipid II:glycine glycyltransferase (peptidoglycan interpeptide bridge formation enzyme)